ncbi:MAG: HEAT repeat domain-containing protein [Acutalibacteraceae bacterium]
MKKILALLMAMIMLLSLAACGGAKDKTDGDDGTTAAAEQKLDYANLTADDLITKFIKDQKNVTLDEYVALVSTLSYVKITDELELEENITSKAISKLLDNDAELPTSEEYIPVLIKNEAPQVRGFAISRVGTLFGVNEEGRATVKEILKTEKEPYVLKCAVEALANEGAEDADIGQFLLDMAKYENPYVREEAAFALGNSWNQELDGAVDAIITLMSDSNDDVRDAAYRYAGKLNDEKVIDPIVKMLKNPDEAKFHASGVESLVTLWYDYPSHENTSEKAYRATMDYLKTKPASDDIPAWTAITSFQAKSESNFEKWLAKATYFDTNEIAQVMTDIVKNPDVKWLGRTGAIKVIAVHCSKADFDALGKVVNGLTDDNAQFIKDEYKNQADSLNK